LYKRKVCSLSAAFLLGTAAAEYGQILPWFILVLYGTAWTHSVRRECKEVKKTAVLCAVFILFACSGIFCSGFWRSFRLVYEPELKENQRCLVQGEIYQKETEEEKNLFYLKNCRVQISQKNYSCNQILLNLKAETYFIGEILCVKGNIRTFLLPANEGGYNERAYYQSLGIDFKVEGEEVVFAGGKKNVFREKLYSFRERIKESYQRAMPEEDAGVLAAMTLGEKNLMDPKRKQIYQKAGISHFYSISGLHISMLGMALYRFLRKTRRSCLFSGGAAAALMLGYGELVGFGVSKSRAIGMFLILMYAKYRGRSYDRLTALAVMAAALTVKNPGYLHNAGFLLSFGAVLGVTLAEQAALRREETDQKEDGKKIVRWIWEKMKDTFCVSFFIQVVTVPVLCQFFYEISVYSVFINLVVLPWMGALLGFGVFGGILGCFFPFFGKCVLYPCNVILFLFDFVCGVFLKLPYASLITGVLSFFGIGLWFAALFFFVFFRKKGKKFSFAFLVPLFFLLAFNNGKKDFELDFLDVGQGDGIYISTGDGTSVFLDGGSVSVKKVGIYRILPFLKYRGVRRVDYWFVSHCDADHINGLMEILEAGYPVLHLAVSESVPKDAAWQELKELAEEKKIPVLKMGKGDRVTGKKENWQIRCLSGKAAGETEDRNENSLVLLFESEHMRAFFAGDIGAGREKELIRENRLPDVDVYKASHHGSNGSNCQELLRAIRPKTAVISCAKKNRYGHPGEEAVQRLLDAGCRIYKTKDLGQVKIAGADLEAEGFAVIE